MNQEIRDRLLSVRVELIEIRKALPEFSTERASTTFAIENITSAIAILETRKDNETLL